jgi:serine/threonine protein kinase
VELLEAASRHVHQSTCVRIKDNYSLLIDGCFEPGDSNSADLVRAFDMFTLAPKIIKFSLDADVDQAIYEKLGLSVEEAIANYIVPMYMIEDSGGKRGIVMPAYANSLSQVKSSNMTKAHATILEPAIFKGLTQIRVALEVLHAKQVIHNDIKPGNILLDFTGDWHLCDLGSCSCEPLRATKFVRLTSFYCPSDISRGRFRGCVKKYSTAYDKMLLAVVALDLLDLLAMDTGFTCQNLVDSAQLISHVDLKVLVNELIGPLLQRPLLQ